MIVIFAVFMVILIERFALLFFTLQVSVDANDILNPGPLQFCRDILWMLLTDDHQAFVRCPHF